MNKKEKALNLFREGYNCSQSVLMACSGMSGVMARAGAAFGGGMGRMQKTCGAVTGAYICFSLAYGSESLPGPEEKERLYGKVREFNRIFVERNGTDLCSALLGEDLSTPEGRRRIEERGLTRSVCEKCISDAIEIIEMLDER